MLNKIIHLEIINKERVENGLKDYLKIMDLFNKLDEPTEEFKKVFNKFYTLKRKPVYFRNEYYSCLFSNKNNKDLKYEDVIKKLSKITNKEEKSFSSKLLHTINPTKYPIIDRIVSNFIGLKATPYSRDKIEDALIRYEKVTSFYKSFIETNNYKECISYFDNNFAYAKDISNLKKIDFLIWGTIEEKKKTKSKNKFKIKLEFDGEVANYLSKIDDKNEYIKDLILTDLKNKNLID